MSVSILQESLFIPYGEGHLHLRKLAPDYGETDKIPILMLHGILSNGRSFYSESGRGLASYLAREGFTVYVMDAAGRGLSTPKLSRDFDPSQVDTICKEIPLAHDFILSQHPQVKKVHWLGHSWGGVLLLSSLIKFTHHQQQVASVVTFGTKRRLRTRSLKKFLMIDLFWKLICPALIKIDGYLAADKWKFGSDGDSRTTTRQAIDWVERDWIDHDDHFDYAKAALDIEWPPCWFITAHNDTVLGNPNDVKAIMKECGLEHAKYTLLSKSNGNFHDYDHSSMLTHADAVNDHFTELADWYHSSFLD